MVDFSHARLNVTLPPPPYGDGPRVLQRLNTPHGSCELAILPDGSLEACVQQPDEPEAKRFRSLPVLVSEAHALTFVVWRIGDSVGLAIEGALPESQLTPGERFPPVATLDPAQLPAYESGTREVIRLSKVELQPGSSFEEPAAQSVCHPAIQRRARQYATGPPNKRNNRPATQREQLDQLRQAVEDLKQLSQAGNSGKLSQFKYIASELRSLVVWKEDKRGIFVANYDPLLFRLANWASLPLPVFAVPRLQVPNWQRALPSGVCLRTRVPTFRRENIEDELIDFQDWLLEEAVLMWPDHTDADPELRTIKSILLLTSVALGGSHYEQLVPRDLDLFKEIESEALDGLQSLLLGLCGTVIGLSEYVVRELEDRGVGT